MIEKLFNQIFTNEERIIIKSKCRAEPYNTMRQAWMLFAYMCDYSVRDIGWCTNRNNRQTRYLIDKAGELYSVNDRELHIYIKEYERKMANACRVGTKVD
ncbi:MAG: hypothetical protein PHU69_12590 [Fermentimonas sp.]|nr:hypothetical protein [Fermentimonas sp.]